MTDPKGSEGTSASRSSIGSGLFDIWARFYDLPLMQQFLYRSVHDAVVDVVRALDATEAAPPTHGLRPSSPISGGDPSPPADSRRAIDNESPVPDDRRLPPVQVLDVGCGTGLLAERLDQAVADRVVGLDFSQGMLAQASARTRDVHWVQGDSMLLPFADGGVDIVTCTESFHWYGDQPAALREFHRVLRPQGRALVALMSPPLDALPALDPLPLPFLRSARWPSPRQLRELFVDAGFEVEDQRRILRIPGIPVPAALLTVGRRLAT